jgi:hypothetical protein
MMRDRKHNGGGRHMERQQDYRWAMERDWRCGERREEGKGRKRRENGCKQANKQTSRPEDLEKGNKATR